MVEVPNIPYTLSFMSRISRDLHEGKSDGVCISPGGRFPPFANQGKPPRKANKGPKDLTLCRVFRKKTCCDVSQTYPALLSIRRLPLTREASQECVQLWELLECSICDPGVGVQPGPPIMCGTLCDRVYRACSNAYFSMDAKTQVLAPCGVGDFVCGRASEWTSNGTELCHAAGFAVKPSHDMEETSCYGGKASLDSITDSWRASKSGNPQRAESSAVWKDFQHWVSEMPFSGRVVGQWEEWFLLQGFPSQVEGRAIISARSMQLFYALLGNSNLRLIKSLLLLEEIESEVQSSVPFGSEHMFYPVQVSLPMLYYANFVPPPYIDAI